MSPTRRAPSLAATLPAPSTDSIEEVMGRFAEVRESTMQLATPLSPEDSCAQSMPDASPVKWHLAHTSWFFETFLLERELPGYRPFHPRFRVLFNSYYNSVGEQWSRPRRGLLTRPSLAQVRAYRAHVDAYVRQLLELDRDDRARLLYVVELGCHHEQQHQELILTDVKHLLAQNPLRPAYRDLPRLGAASSGMPLHWHAYDEGLREIGHDGGGFAFDNELPRHRVFVQRFELASRPVTNGEYLSFMEAGGYEQPDLWLSEGWATVQREGWRAPLYWEQRDGAWHIMTLAGLREIYADTPVCHLSFYEADAYARFAGARLPSEAEWETAAASVPAAGNLVESGRLHPAPAPTRARQAAPVQLFGDVWEWTRSPYGPYPGYRPLAGALGEYNGKFMSSQMVLRGGSCVTPRSHLRATYRNFFYPSDRWQFSGVRLARDGS